MNNRCDLINQVTYDAVEIAKKISGFINTDNCKTVFIKPNMVIDPWKGEENSWIATVTHPSLIEAVLIVLKEKMKDTAEIIIGDAPMARSNHEKTLRLLHIRDIISKYRSDSFKISLIDIREWYWKYISTMCVSRKKLSGDPLGNKLVNLFSDSMFYGKENKTYEAFDNIHPVSEFHNETDNIFSISASILKADLFINLPKLKTHRIAGMTCAMKNLVGINSNKNCVPHNTSGSVNQGGDSCPDNSSISINQSHGIGGIARKFFRKKNPLLNYLFVPFKLVYDVIHPTKEKIGWGMWHGNDTIWRSIIDLNRIILYCDKNGNMQETYQRKYLCITDAVIAGEGEGPLHPTPKKTNLLIVSDNPVIVDSVAAEMMGFDWQKMPFLYNAFNRTMRWQLICDTRDNIEIHTNSCVYKIKNIREFCGFYFKPTSGWKDHIEKTNLSIG